MPEFTAYYPPIKDIACFTACVKKLVCTAARTARLGIAEGRPRVAAIDLSLQSRVDSVFLRLIYSFMNYKRIFL